MPSTLAIDLSRRGGLPTGVARPAGDPYLLMTRRRICGLAMLAFMLSAACTPALGQDVAAGDRQRPAPASNQADASAADQKTFPAPNLADASDADQTPAPVSNQDVVFEAGQRPAPVLNQDVAPEAGQKPAPALNQKIIIKTGRRPEPARLLLRGTVENCNSPGHILPAGTLQTDLEINGITCTVDGSASYQGVSGVYVYRNVNIYNGGTLTFKDAQIDFHAHSILVEMNSTLEAGATSPITGPLTIWLWGLPTDANSITCKSDNQNQCGVPDDVWTSNRNVPMKQMAGMTCVKASSLGYKLPVDDCFYQYEVLDTGDVPGAYFGRKVLAVSVGGNLILRGAKGIRTGMPMETSPADSSTSWARLTKTLVPGQSCGDDGPCLYIDRAVPTWAPGDHIVVTTTDYLPGHTEELVIKKVVTDANGTRIDIDPSTPVQSQHWGQVYSYSSIAADIPGVGPAPDLNVTGLKDVNSPLPANAIETRAIVALLSRSIRIASEGPQPVISRTEDHFLPIVGNYYGGHTIVRQGFSTYEVQGVEFYQLGQGGALGRYPVHFHMDRSVPQPNATTKFLGTFVADSSIVDSMTRFITVHATQGVTLARNVGYKSIGHGFYLEDATETNNRFYSNVGISVRGALADSFTNPRMVPGILDLYAPNGQPAVYPNPYVPPNTPGAQIPEVFPYYTDVTNPAVFWIQNTWNDFEYNAAVGAGACGACYWMPPAGISGPSQYEVWDAYASLQKDPIFYGAAPLMAFKGNSCSTAMSSIQTVGATAQCTGVVFGEGGPSDDNDLVSVVNPNAPQAGDFPKEGAQRQHTTICNSQGDCSNTPPCTPMGVGLQYCLPFVIDHYTTSFNWPETNFAAIWMRAWWALVQNTAITDVQNGGITFVSGGGYTRSDASQGFWSVLKDSILVGNAQPIDPGTGFPANPSASNAGPFTPMGIKTCGNNPDKSLFCASAANGVIFLNSNFAGNQRLFNIYDGPSNEYNNIYSDVHVTRVGTVDQCQQGKCADLGYMNAYNTGTLQSPPTGKTTNNCILPNAAIAWKQPNGFYYPPAFNSDNLVFNNVDIRHFVIQPLYTPYQKNYFTQDMAAIQNTYCAWSNDMFSSAFTDIDRQTELTDNDGSLTGLTANDTQETPSAGPSISVTKANFYNAPVVTDECASGQLSPTDPTSSGTGAATVDTSPYEYFTTAMVAECALQGANCNNNWTSNGCTKPTCYGVPVYRQYLTEAELHDFQGDNTHRPSIRMMGQASAQRSTLTLNHGTYYIDTTVPLSTQNPGNAPENITQVNVFQPGGIYDIFFLFATNRTKQVYSMYIGKSLSQDQAKAVMTPGRMMIPDNSYPFKTASGSWATFGSYDATTGLLTVNIDLSQQSELEVANREAFCQPTTYCAWNSNDNTCGCKPGSDCTDNKVCSFGTKDIDCPVDGCYGFRITLPSTFVAESQPNLPPTPVLFSTDPYFQKGRVTFEAASESAAGNCHYTNVPTQQDLPTDSRGPAPARPIPWRPMQVESIRWPNP